jgi:transglutaminase-like putative cysteine protease
MRLYIEHTTIYRYERPVSFGRHRLVLRPREGHDLRVERMELQITPGYSLEWIRDVFGNSIAVVDVSEPADRLTITNIVTVERLRPFPERVYHQPWRVPFPPSYDMLEIPITDFYRTPVFPDDGARVRQWLAEWWKPDELDAEGSMQQLCEQVYRTVRYQRRPERGVQNPARTLDLATGSCRDMATLMMEAARHLAVAARFASGYLHGTVSMAGRASTHAWTEVYLPSLGWRGFDPTLGGPVSLHHVVTGVSHHPRGVMPISGAFLGTRADAKALEVTVLTRELPEKIQVASPV